MGLFTKIFKRDGKENSIPSTSQYVYNENIEQAYETEIVDPKMADDRYEKWGVESPADSSSLRPIPGSRDVYFEEAGELIIKQKKASIGMLQRHFEIGFNRASRLMDQLAYAGIVGPEEGTKPRSILITMEQFQRYLEEYGVEQEADFLHSSKRSTADSMTDEEKNRAIFDRLGSDPSFSFENVLARSKIGNAIILKAEYDDPLDFVDSIMLHCHYNKVKIILFDTMGILGLFKGLPHLLIPPVTTNLEIGYALNWLVNEIERRKNIIINSGFRDFITYNQNTISRDAELPLILIVNREIKDIISNIDAYMQLKQIAPYCTRFGVSVISFSMYERKHLELGNLEISFALHDPSWCKNIFAGSKDTSTTSLDGLPKIDSMTGIEFEEFCAQLFENNGFSNVSVTKASGDYGGDILAIKDQIKYVIQCKRYESAIGVHAVQEVIASRSIYKTHVGAVITNSYYTPQAKTLAEVNNIILWDRDDLVRMINSRLKK